MNQIVIKFNLVSIQLYSQTMLCSVLNWKRFGIILFLFLFKIVCFGDVGYILAYYDLCYCKAV